MESILIGISMIFSFILGLGIGITVPFFVKKYIKEYIKPNLIIEEKENNNSEEKPKSLTPDIIDEWLNGKEGAE